MDDSLVFELKIGDCRTEMQAMDAESVDCIVTDPPYGLKFMGREWDHGVPGIPFWVEALRAAKPGAHLLAFGGTRTFHRLTVAIEDAGWEIRDCLMWLYGSGFPKSHSISKAIDKMDGTEASADAAIPWNGWGTALKPAFEPIVLARKPFAGTVAANVLANGTGALNIDGCRVPGIDPANAKRLGKTYGDSDSTNFGDVPMGQVVVACVGGNLSGRWPANVLLDEEAAAELDEQSGTLKSGFLDRSKISAENSIYGMAPRVKMGIYPPAEGGASRFFYTAKASKTERSAGLPADMKNDHVSVKPLKLMEYLCRLICPPDGLILDPFMGSGSTGVAALNEGFHFIGIDENEHYVNDIAAHRLAVALAKRQNQLFEGGAV